MEPITIQVPQTQAAAGLTEPTVYTVRTSDDPHVPVTGKITVAAGGEPGTAIVTLPGAPPRPATFADGVLTVSFSDSTGTTRFAMTISQEGDRDHMSGVQLFTPAGSRDVDGTQTVGVWGAEADGPFEEG